MLSLCLSLRSVLLPTTGKRGRIETEELTLEPVSNLLKRIYDLPNVPAISDEAKGEVVKSNIYFAPVTEAAMREKKYLQLVPGTLTSHFALHS